MREEPVRTARSRRATISDVAALAGVSTAAVSQVFNGTGKISRATSERIREAARSLDWAPSPTATALRSSRTHTLGLVLNRPRDLEIGPSSPALISGIESILAPRRYGLLLYLIDRDLEEETRTYRELSMNRRVDGVVLTDSRLGDPRFALMRELGLPAVLLGTPASDDPVPHIDSDPPGAGVDDAVHHLLELGHRRLAYVGGPADRMQARARQEMFEETVRGAGLSPVAVLPGEYSPESGAELTGRLLDLADPPTGIVYGADPMAMGALAVAHRRGVRVPEDLSVVGFDGLPVGEWLHPSLTTVQRDHVQRGRAVATLLLGLLGESIEDPPTLRRPFLVVRDSSSAPPEGRA